MLELTENQKAILEWVRAFIKEKGHSPKNVEIAAAFGISEVRIHQQIRIMAMLGALKIVGKRVLQVGDETPLTETQHKVLKLFASNTVSTQRQAAAVLGIAAPSLSEHLSALKKIGAVEIVDGKVMVKVAC